MKDIKLLIIPDVHGRKFWIDAVDYVLKNTDAHIVFLGDYLDPYSGQGATHKSSFSMFKDIVVLKRENTDRITLLQGNHDASYSISLGICECRTNYNDYDEIKGVFKANKENFDLAYGCTINNKQFILSHAGITKKWVEYMKEVDGFNENDIVNSVNNIFHNGDITTLKRTLSPVSYARGGWCDFGSIVWASAIDDTNPSEMYGDAIQIVGHTQLQFPVKDGDSLYFVDAREPIYINSNGDVLKYNTDDRIADVNELK